MSKLIQVRGTGFGSSPATISVVVDGEPTFTGAIPTLDIPPSSFPSPGPTPEQMQILFSIDYDTGTDTEKIISITANSGSLTLFDELQNYFQIDNPVFTSEELAVLSNPASTAEEKSNIRFAKANPPFTAEEQAIYLDPTTTPEVKNQMRTDHNVQTTISTGPTGFYPCRGESRTAVYLDGVLQDPNRGIGEDGTWYWYIPTGSTLSYTNVITTFFDPS